MNEENTTTTTTTEAPADTGASARIRALSARVKELEGQLAEARPLADSAADLRAKLEEIKAESKAQREAAQLERAIFAAGITDEEGIEYVQHAYGKLAVDGRPTLGEWLGNREALPRAVRAYLPDGTPAPAAPTAPAPTVTLPKQSAGTIPAPPPTPSSWSPEAIMRLSPSEFKANRDAIKAALKAP